MQSAKELLAGNINEFYKLGLLALEQKANNSAVSLFFKALAVLGDLWILQKEGFVPKSHSERFRILQAKYPKIYAILDKDFPAYQESYKIRLSEELAEVLQHDVQQLAKEVGFSLL